jgi:CPA2 family monovalent cation:H+ antiporter-2
MFMSIASHLLADSIQIGAFLSGLMVGVSSDDGAAVRHFVPIRHMFAALFYASVGMLLRPTFLIEHITDVLATVATFTLIKVIIVWSTLLLLGEDSTVAHFMGVSLCPMGEYAFLLALEGLSVGFLPKDVYHILVGCAAVSTILSPFVSRILLPSRLKTAGVAVFDLRLHALGPAKKSK